MEKYPSWPKGHPWKGCRSLIAARGFKSLLLRSGTDENRFLFSYWQYFSPTGAGRLQGRKVIRYRMPDSYLYSNKGVQSNMIRDIREHLLHKIIPFWESLRDDENGGYYGYVDHDLHVNRKTFKGCILNNRITWFFSSAAKLFMDERDGKVNSANPPRRDGSRAGAGLITINTDRLTIRESSGRDFSRIYAMLLSEAAGASMVYDVTRDEEALRIALDLYRIIEGRCRDEGGYLEAFDREFKPSSNEKLSENGVLATRTMNTLLHVFEAYTELIRVLSGVEMAEVFGCGSPARCTAPEKQEFILELRERLDEIFTIFTEKMYNPEKHRMEVFFDHEYRPLIDLVSYGHDIETSWLIDRGCDVIRLAHSENGTGSSEGNVLLKKMEKIARDLSAAIYRTGFDGHSLPEECENGIVKTSRTWWMQAETLVGFLNAYQHDMTRTEYLDAAHSVWEYICEYQVDHREGSEWFHDLYEDGTPFENQPIVEQWKCPYHNGRMCIEVIRRGVW